ncbi:MAG: hypothetical protein ACT6TH_15340 [Brevundimonas sp.]|uniref:hypothetical protein n=1 Tax=Brevundimonas sp. TaxID=1871086 RepID=UPI0040339FF2
MAKPKKQRKPTDPQTITQRRAERRELEARGLSVNVDERTEEIKAVWRDDVFSLLLRGRPEEAAAIQWLETLLRTASGEAGVERRPDFIRGSCEGAPGQNVTDAMIEASRTLAAVESATPTLQLRLLFDLLKPDAGQKDSWRETVQRVTSEVNPHAQSAAVRAACATMVWVQANIRQILSAYERARDFSGARAAA